MFSSWIDWGAWRSRVRAASSSHVRLSTWRHGQCRPSSLGLGHVGQVSALWNHCFSLSVLSGGGPPSPAHVQDWLGLSSSWNGEYWYVLFDILLYGRFVPYTFVYSVIYLCHCELTRVNFILLALLHYYIDFVQNVWALAIESSLGLAPGSLWCAPTLLYFERFLALWGAPGSPCIVPAPTPPSFPPSFICWFSCKHLLFV